jgi:hypothetical protein
MAELVTLVTTKSALRVVAVAMAQGLSLARLGGRTILVKQAQLVVMGFGTAALSKVITVTQASLTTLQRAMARSFSMAVGEAVTLARRLGKAVGLVSPQAVSLARAMAKTVLVASPEAMSAIVGKFLSHAATAPSPQAVTLALVRFSSRALTVAMGEAISLRRAMGKAVVLGQASLVTFAARAAKSLALALLSPSFVTLALARNARNYAQAVVVALAETVTLLRLFGHGRPISIVSGEAVVLSRAVRSAIAVVLGQAIAAARTIGVQRLVQLGELVSLGRRLGKIIALFDPEHATLSAGITRSRAIAVAMGEAVSVAIKIAGRAMAATILTAQRVTVTRTLGHLVTVRIGQAIGAGRSFFTTIALTTRDLVTLLIRLFKHDIHPAHIVLRASTHDTELPAETVETDREAHIGSPTRPASVRRTGLFASIRTIFLE